MPPFVRPRVLALALFAVVATLLAPTAASAATQTFHRFEAEATANYVVNVACDDGRTVQQRVTVIGGYEEESSNGEPAETSEFLTVLYRGFDCEGNFFSTRGSGPAEFSYSPSLRTASVSGTIPLSNGSTATVNMSWEGTGPITTTQNQTNFPGFTGHFTGRERDAVATGTVVIDGETIVDGSTTNASIETLEDTNRSTP